MKAKTELFLYQCLWVANAMSRPTWRNILGSFEEWAYRGGFLRQIQTLEADGWIESQKAPQDTERVFRLTEKGWLKALGGRDPARQYQRGWDGKWRMILFDLPESKRGLRNELRRQLKSAQFGGLQKSVWVSPDPVDAIGESLKKTAASAGVIFFFEGTGCLGEGDANIVRQAWNFERINGAIEAHRLHIRQIPDSGEAGWRERLLEWATVEKNLWSRVLEVDPLLPRELWPENYLGEKAWKNRLAVLRKAGEIVAKGHANL
jgi:phenylacetic acid degradation operon negative regulatory protein